MHLYCTLVGPPWWLAWLATTHRPGPPHLDLVVWLGRGWQFGWGGSLLKSNGGVHEAPQGLPLGKYWRCWAAKPTSLAGVAKAACYIDPTPPLGQGVD